MRILRAAARLLRPRPSEPEADPYARPFGDQTNETVWPGGTPTTSRSSDDRGAAHPHCDDLVLHAPGECVHCDAYPERQRQRQLGLVNFTGQTEAHKEACPSTYRRPLETIERWPGNRAQPVDADGENEAWREWGHSVVEAYHRGAVEYAARAWLLEHWGITRGDLGLAPPIIQETLIALARQRMTERG